MANGRVGNIYRADSEGLLEAANMKIQAISFWSLNTTGVMKLAYVSDTANTIFTVTNPFNNPATLTIPLQDWPVRGDRLFMTLITAGTAFFFLK